MAKKNETKTENAADKLRFQEILNECNPHALIDFFKDMPEEDRKIYSPIAREFAKNRWDYTREIMDNPERKELHKRIRQYTKTVDPDWECQRGIALCAGIAVVATTDMQQIRKARRENQIWYFDYDLQAANYICSALRYRPPEIIFGVLELACEANPWVEKNYWCQYRKLVKDRVIEPSSSDQWIRIMFSAMVYDSSTGNFSAEKPIIEQLRDDPVLLENEVWRIFEATDFPARWSYSDIDRQHRWKDAIVELIGEGKLDKNRVLDYCFAALERPQSDFRLRWFVQLLERISLDAKENERYFKRFLDLALHHEPTPRALGLKFFEAEFKSGKVNDSDAMIYLPILLRETSKAKVKKGLSISEKIFKRSPEFSSEIILSFTNCLQHEQGEVQQVAADFLLKHVDILNSGQKEEIQQLSKNSEPSVKRSLASIFSSGLPEPQETSVETVAKPSRLKTNDIPDPVEPIHTVEELIDAILRFYQTHDDAEEMERIIDGIARLHNNRDENSEKQIALLRNHLGYAPFINVLKMCWCTYRIRLDDGTISYDKQDGLYPEMIRHRESPRNYAPFTSLIHYRTDYLLKRMDQFETVRLLSTPTHRHYFLDPQVLAERIATLEDDLSNVNMQDQLLAILRLGGWNRKEALVSLKKIKAQKQRQEYIDAVRYALGDDVKIGPTAPFWVAASRIRDPQGIDTALQKTHPELGVGLSCPPLRKSWLEFHKGGSYDYQYWPGFVTSWQDTIALPKPEQDYPTAILYRQGGSGLDYGPLVTGIFLSIWPSNIRLFYHKLAGVMAGRMHKKTEAAEGVYPYTVMLDRTEPVGPEGGLLLAAGLGAAQMNVNAAAVDAMIQCVEHERITVDDAVIGCRELLKFLEPAKSDKDLAALTLKANRWLKPLKTVAQESPRHALFVRNLLEPLLPEIPERELSTFLELFYELSLETRTKISEETKVFLEQLKPTSKAAKLAKNLLKA